MSAQTNLLPNVGVRDESTVRDLKGRLLEDYQQGRLARRDALRRMAGIAVSLLIGEDLLAACAPLPTPTLPAAPSDGR